MLAVLVSGLFAFQDPAPAPTPPAPPPSSQEVWDDKTAKARIKEFEKLLRGKPSMGERKRALDDLAQGHNKLLVKPIARVVETDESVVIRKHAVELLQAQPVVDVSPVLLKLLRDGKVTANAQVHASLIRGVARCGYTPKLWREIDGVFEADYATERVPVHEAVLDLVIQHKEQQALPLLLRNFDEPTPENVDAGDNPPAEYWKARWHSWAAWKGKVKEALAAITGQQFASAAEAKAWLEKNPLPKRGADGAGGGEPKRK